MRGRWHVLALGLALTLGSCGDSTTTPPVATQLAFVEQPVGTIAGLTLFPIKVAIQDATGSTINSNAFVSLSVGEGLNQPLIGTTNVQAVNGVATFSGLRIETAGSGYQLIASLPGLPPDTSNAFTINPDEPVRMRFAMLPLNAVAGVSLSEIWVVFEDQFDNHAFASGALVTVAIANNPGGAVLSGTLSKTVPGAVASFTDLMIDKSGAGYTLIATTPGFPSHTTNPFNVKPGAATKLRFTVPPSNTVAGASISPAVVVEALDPFDNVDTTFKRAVTMSLVTSNGATLQGTTVVTAVEGRATFPNLSIAQAANAYELGASAVGVASATSPPFDILGAMAARLTLSVPPLHSPIR